MKQQYWETQTLDSEHFLEAKQHFRMPNYNDVRGLQMVWIAILLQKCMDFVLSPSRHHVQVGIVGLKKYFCATKTSEIKRSR